MRTLLFLALFVAFPLYGQTAELWPGAQYDPAVPTFQSVLGYQPGGRIAPHSDIVRYFEALAAAAPDRVKLFDYGKTWEGRRLFFAVVSSPENLRRLDEIRAGVRKLTDPRITSPAEAGQLIESLPAVIMLAYGVHGNEISSPDAAMFTAYHLLASRNDPMVADILKNTVVMLDPQQNPDGRDRFVHDFEMARGLEPDASPLAAEHVEPWPGGRTNHYYFDMNRDWFALTQPEIRSLVRALLEWYPQVFIDLHEMGPNTTYYFTPGSQPLQPLPHRTTAQRPVLVREEQRQMVRPVRFPLFHPRVVRRLLSGLRRKLAGLLRGAGGDLRVRVGARAGDAAPGRHRIHLPRHHSEALRGFDFHLRNGRHAPARAARELLQIPADGHRRGADRPRTRVHPAAYRRLFGNRQAGRHAGGHGHRSEARQGRLFERWETVRRRNLRRSTWRSRRNG